MHRALDLGETRTAFEPGCAGVNVSSVSGGVSYGRGGDAEDWRPASVGLPVATGDRLYAARGASLELRNAEFEVHLASGTGREAIELTDGVRRFYVWDGSASFLVRQSPLGPGDLARIEGIPCQLRDSPPIPSRRSGTCRGATRPSRDRDRVLAFRSRGSR